MCLAGASCGAVYYLAHSSRRLYYGRDGLHRPASDGGACRARPSCTRACASRVDRPNRHRRGGSRGQCARRVDVRVSVDSRRYDRPSGRHASSIALESGGVSTHRFAIDPRLGRGRAARTRNASRVCQRRAPCARHARVHRGAIGGRACDCRGWFDRNHPAALVRARPRSSMAVPSAAVLRGCAADALET